MYIKPAFRGKGVNKMIVDALILWAHSQNIQEIRLDVYAENSGAIKAYEKAGFNPLLLNMRLGV